MLSKGSMAVFPHLLRILAVEFTVRVLPHKAGVRSNSGEERCNGEVND
jgi:hypothetical protein